MPHRIARVQKTLPPRAAALVTDPVSRRYLTGFDSSDGVLFIAPQAALLLTDSRYVEAARQSVTACPVEELADAPKQLREVCAQHRVKRLFVETQRVTLAQAARWRGWLPGVWIERGGLLDQALRELRMHKAQAEIGAVQAAQGIAEEAFAQILPLLRPGVSERAIALELDYAMLRGGAEAVSFETIAVSGENGSKPHGVPGGRELRSGDLLTLDFGAVVDGYHSDMTRTVAIGPVDEERRRVYDTVLRAQRAALSALAPGVPCKDADAAARDIVKAAGYGGEFRHGTGHGVGLEIHEAPTLSAKSKDTLAPGMVVTVEPGIYLPERFGVRIEDMALITETGVENLTNTGKELVEL